MPEMLEPLPLFADQQPVPAQPKATSVGVLLAELRELRGRAHGLSLPVEVLDAWLADLAAGDDEAAAAFPAYPRLRVEIPGEPFSQPRARSFPLMSGGAPVLGAGGRPIMRHYNPEKAVSWKAAAQDHMGTAMAAAGYSAPFVGAGPVYLEISAYFTCPKSDHRKRDPRGLRRHAKTKDFDNIAKAVMDAAKGVLWLDDRQVSDAHVNKYIAPQGEAPRVVVRLWALPEEI